MLKLRKAVEEDCDILFDWANEEECRKNSFSTEPIPYENHCNWVKNQLVRKDSDLFILQEDEPVGMLRLDYQGDGATISYSIARNLRGKGYGKKILQLAEEFVRENRSEKYLMGEVKKENSISRYLFTLLGYQETEEGTCIKYLKEIL